MTSFSKPTYTHSQLKLREQIIRKIVLDPKVVREIEESLTPRPFVGISIYFYNEYQPLHDSNFEYQPSNNLDIFCTYYYSKPYICNLKQLIIKTFGTTKDRKSEDALRISAGTQENFSINIYQIHGPVNQEPISPVSANHEPLSPVSVNQEPLNNVSVNLNLIFSKIIISESSDPSSAETNLPNKLPIFTLPQACIPPTLNLAQDIDKKKADVEENTSLTNTDSIELNLKHSEFKKLCKEYDEDFVKSKNGSPFTKGLYEELIVDKEEEINNTMQEIIQLSNPKLIKQSDFDKMTFKQKRKYIKTEIFNSPILLSERGTFFQNRKKRDVKSTLAQLKGQ